MAPSGSAAISRSREPAMTIEAVPFPERPALLERIIAAAIQFRWAILAAVALLCAIGAWSFQRLPIDATPDITNVQVQINSEAAGFSPLEAEQRVTFPVETAIAGRPGLQYTRPRPEERQVGKEGG